MKELILTKENFDQEIANNKTLIVDFFANWCGPCKMMAPILDEIAEEYNVKVGKVNVDEQMELADRYQIDAIPAIYLFRDGKLDTMQVGYLTKEDLVNYFKLTK